MSLCAVCGTPIEPSTDAEDAGEWVHTDSIAAENMSGAHDAETMDPVAARANLCRCCGDGERRLCGWCYRHCLRQNGTLRPSRKHTWLNPHKPRGMTK